MPDDDEAPAYKAACAEEEAAIQALGEMTPTTVAGAAAQLQYMADVEGTFATGGSPLLQIVLTVRRRWLALAEGRSHERRKQMLAGMAPGRNMRIRLAGSRQGAA